VGLTTPLVCIHDKCARTSFPMATPSESLTKVYFARMERLTSAVHDPELLQCIHYNSFQFRSRVLTLLSATLASGVPLSCCRKQ
jgi:hypothetical protein